MAQRMKIHLLVIDPQHDFCNKNGSLFVTGADADMKRLAGFIDRVRDKIDDIHVTVDSHQEVDISHPLWWKDSSGKHPGPFTMISPADVADGRWNTSMPGAFKRSLDYLRTLEKNKRYMHTIWPEHCIIGSEGHTVDPDVRAALHGWCTKHFALVDYVTKGSNPWTEHFSGYKAEVPDPSDPTTQPNTRLLKTLEEADVILLAGEALSHCLAHTVRDVAADFADPRYVEKMVLLTDASSPVADPPAVPGLFTGLAKQFVADMIAKGMKTTTTSQFLATA